MAAQPGGGTSQPTQQATSAAAPQIGQFSQFTIHPAGTVPPVTTLHGYTRPVAHICPDLPASSDPWSTMAGQPTTEFGINPATQAALYSSQQPSQPQQQQHYYQQPLERPQHFGPPFVNYGNRQQYLPTVDTPATTSEPPPHAARTQHVFTL
ncbi:hypothetical protein IscW_ISCW004771 [Ixodes scapularis]|uniref:Uncharacterized protein n=1 Tax=Ixodes scapularis TaxID=6945 RepID=B7PEP0_IXOSC|nr:hypothetical protein IscW_ISCW004771 [Ixodes scapularis]|eukprot:XP_002433662.1 hypothetical protein IscW_ISCW004771 [Ixodes scapularis]